MASQRRQLAITPTPTTLSTLRSQQDAVQELFRIVNDPSTVTESETTDQKVATILQALEASFQPPLQPDDNEDDNDTDRFNALIGYYNVSYTLQKAKANAQKRQNPVGGKWTRSTGWVQKLRLLRTSRTLQHVLPTNTTGLMQDPLAVAEAINVITLQALFGLVSLNIILRGDAVPLLALPQQQQQQSPLLLPNLSPLAVRAFFDPPRIVVGTNGRFLNMNVGPASSVVLDATYVDDRVRIGLGGTSGTKFVFSRCSANDAQARDCLALLQKKPVTKAKAAWTLLSLAGTGIYGAARRGSKVMGTLLAVASLLSLGIVLSSSGGIEVGNKDTYQPAGK
jgi:hypothetical protein